METKRLLFREFRIEDAKDLYELNSDPEVLKYTGDLPFESIDHAKSFIESYSEYRERGFGRWALVRKEDNAFVGWCGLKLNEENETDLGFRIKKEFWRKGYATESAQECIRLGFEKFGLKRIIARSAKENTASIRVIQKLNMKFNKSSPCHGIPDAQYFTLEKTDYTKEN